MYKLRTTELYRDEQRRLIVIESIEMSLARFKNGSQVYASITPVAVVICRQEGNNVLAIDVQAKLKQRSELEELIARVCS